MTVSEVTADGKPLHFVHRDDRLQIDLPQPSVAGNGFSFALRYKGTPATGLQIGNNRYGDRGFFSNDWPDLARNWLATFDHPSMKAAVAMTVRGQSALKAMPAERNSPDMPRTHMLIPNLAIV